MSMKCFDRIAVMGVVGVWVAVGTLFGGCGGGDSGSDTTTVISTNATGQLTTNVVSTSDGSSSGSGITTSSGSTTSLTPHVALFSRSMTGHWTETANSGSAPFTRAVDLTQTGDALTGTWSDAAGFHGSATGSKSGAHVTLQFTISDGVWAGFYYTADGNCNPLVDDITGEETGSIGTGPYAFDFRR